MKQSYLLSLLFSLAAILPAFGLVDPLKTVPGFAPAFILNETITEKVDRYPDEFDGFAFDEVTSDSSSVSITANISGVILANINPATPFEITVGELSLTGTLGEDDSYTEKTKTTKRSIFIPARFDDEGNTIGSSGVKLSWSATRLTISISRSLLDIDDPGSAAATVYAGLPEPGKTQFIKDVIPVSVKFAEFASAPRIAFIQGTSTVKRQTFGSEDDGTFQEFLLDTVKITGGFDLALPTSTITAPANNSSPGGNFTLTGKASDGHGIAAIEYTNSPDLAAPWLTITEITNLPPTLPTTLGSTPWGSTNKSWSLSLSGQPYGTNKFWVRAVDTSGNRSNPVSVSLINPLPTLLTGRWDGLITPSATGRNGYLTFTSDVKGSLLTGKLQLEGTTAALPFTGTWSGDSITATISRKSGRPLLLTGRVNSTSPADAGAALLSFTLSELAASTIDPPLPLGSGTAFRSPFSTQNKLQKLTSPAPSLGRFNLSIAPGNGSTSPSGYGYLSLSVTDTGAVTVAGKTADGFSFTSSPVLGAAGQVPVFIPLYDGAGSFSVLEVIDMSTGSIASTSANWNRPASFKDKQFASGFSVAPAVQGERYVAPAVNTRVLGLIAASPNAGAEWIGDAVPVAMTQALEVSKTNAVIAKGGNSAFKAAITSATGIISGSFILPASKVATPWSALIVGSQANGHYISPPVAPSTVNRFGKISLSGDSPELAGSDDFNDNNKDLSKWFTSDYAYGGGTLTEINGRLEFTIKSAVAESESLRPWTRNFGSLDTEFEAIVDLHNASSPSTALSTGAQQKALVGMLIYNSADVTDNVYISLHRGNDGLYFMSTLTVDDTEIDYATADHASPDGSVRLLYNPVTRVISTFYDADGATNGYSWTPLGSFSINDFWSLLGDPVLGITVGGYAEKMAITPGQVYADNFQTNTIAAP